MLLRPGHLSLDELQAIHAGGQPLLIDPAALPAIQASAHSAAVPCTTKLRVKRPHARACR